LFDIATFWLIKNKVLLPGASTLTRLISVIRERTANRLFKELSSLPTSEQKGKLLSLTKVAESKTTSLFDFFKKGPTRISAPSFNETLDRYLKLETIGISKLTFSKIPYIRIKALARYASMTSIYSITRMPDEKRMAILIAFIKVYETIALDDAIDVLVLLIAEIDSDAKKLGRKNRLRSIKDLDKSAIILSKVCSLLLKEESSEKLDLKELIYPVIPIEEIKKAVSVVNEITRPQDDKFHQEMIAQYGRIKNCLKNLYQHLKLKSTPAGDIVLKALAFLASKVNNKSTFLVNPPMEILTAPWKRLVLDKHGRADKKGYTLCFLDKLLKVKIFLNI
jgi:hypothetical protein